MMSQQEKKDGTVVGEAQRVSNQAELNTRYMCAVNVGTVCQIPNM